MQTLLFVGLTAALWSFFHSLMITHGWQRWQDRTFPPLVPFSRLIYVSFSTLSLAAIFYWWRTLPQTLLWDWSGPWQILRFVGLTTALIFFALGARAYDNRAFLGIRQAVNHWRGEEGGEPKFSLHGILGKVRHPWYTGTILFFIFCLPLTDVNVTWRSVFIVYTLVGTELEERKLMAELGQKYSQYRRDVGRFLPR